VKNLRAKYGAQGYIYTQVTPSWVFAEELDRVIVTITIEEGDQFRVGWIEVNGNFQTQEKVVRRELGFYPEELYDTTKTEAAEKRLKGTRLFSEAMIIPIEPTDGAFGVRDAVVTVEESPKTTNFIAGLGASSDLGLTGNIILENTNFDLFDWPRSWEEFFKGRAFHGAGQTMRIQLEPGTEQTRFRIDFREPYFLDREIGFGTSLYLFERGRDGYDEERAGTQFSFDRRFEEGLLAGWAGEVAFRAEYVNVDDVEWLAAEDIRDVEGGSYLSSVKLSLLHDTTDSRLDPSQGHRFQMAWEQAGLMGGDFTHSTATASYAQHWTVAIDEEDRRSVVTAHGRVGQIFGDAPVFDRFYAGGIGSMRGFDYRGISPRAGVRDNRVGGDFMLLTGGEYSFPLYAKAIRGVFFLDMGTVEKDFGITTWRAAVGGGVRLTLDILGSVPMEFDLALPVSKDGEDDERIFTFFIGLPFF
jgi:outer membrane protein insertion porin family